LHPDYPQHTGIAEPFPGIWLNNDGTGSDLRITNTLARPVAFRASEDASALVVSAGML
jgi:hypothetical protein